MDLTDRIDRRLAAGLLLVGAVLAVIGNVLHPFVPADVTTREFLDEAGGSAIWVPLHLGIVVAIALLTAGLVVVLRGLRGTAGEGLATVTAVLAIAGGTVFAVQIGVLDGYVLPQLAEVEPVTPALLAAATLATTIDGGMLALVVLGYFGAAFLTFGLAVRRAGAFDPWIRWTALGTGAAGVVIGVLMMGDVAGAFTFVAFRVVALGATVVALGLGWSLRREPVAATDAAAAPA